MSMREAIEWCDTWVTSANNDSLPRLLLVGDSITQSYFYQVEAALNGQYLCARLTTSACVCDLAFEKQLSLLMEDYRFDTIHFNNGLHGWDYDELSYGKGLCQVLDFIRRQSPSSRLILANTTPVRRANSPCEFDPKTARVRERNRLANAIAVARNLPINDLFCCVIDHPEYVLRDGLHYNPDGQKALGMQVSRIVLDVIV